MGDEIKFKEEPLIFKKEKKKLIIRSSTMRPHHYKSLIKFANPSSPSWQRCSMPYTMCQLHLWHRGPCAPNLWVSFCNPSMEYDRILAHDSWCSWYHCLCCRGYFLTCWNTNYWAKENFCCNFVESLEASELEGLGGCHRCIEKLFNMASHLKLFVFKFYNKKKVAKWYILKTTSYDKLFIPISYLNLS